MFFPDKGMDVTVKAQVTTLAHRFDVGRYSTERQARAKMSGCEDDDARLEDTGLPVLMAASARMGYTGPRMTFPDALTATQGAAEADPAREANPRLRVLAEVVWHWV